MCRKQIMSLTARRNCLTGCRRLTMGSMTTTCLICPAPMAWAQGPRVGRIWDNCEDHQFCEDHGPLDVDWSRYPNDARETRCVTAFVQFS